MAGNPGRMTFRTTGSLWEGLLQLLWPRECLVCGVPIIKSDEGLCGSCRGGLLECINPDYCPGCGCSLSRYAVIDGRCATCRGSAFHFDGIARAGLYGGKLREMICSLKFRGNAELARILSDIADAALNAGFFKGRIEILVPVPLHWTRRISRRFNQSLVICRNLRSISVPISGDLVRIRNTRYQSTLSVPQRRRNVTGAFAVRKGHIFSGKTVCLVDDITTSRATLDECARVLKDAGAKEVYGLVLAVAESDDV